MRGAPGAAPECPGPSLHCCWGLPHAPCCTPQALALHQVSHMFHQLGHRHQQWHLQAAVACLALVPATLQALSAQSLAVSHSAGAVMLELLSRLSVPIMPSSCHAIILCINCLPCMRHQLSLDHASSQIMTLIVKLHARLMFLFLALALIHEGRCRMQITRVQLHQSDLMCMMSHVPDTCWRSICFD